MKPSFESEKPFSPAVSLQPETADIAKKSYARRFAIWIVLVLVTVIVVTSVVLVSVHVATKATRDNYKEAMVMFKDEHGNLKLTEQITVTETKEDVVVPDTFRIILDYGQGLMVMQFSNADNEMNGVCYVARFKGTDDIDSVRDTITSDVMEETVTADPIEQSFESIGEQVDRDILSPRARQMCYAHPVYWARATTGTGNSTDRRKRDTFSNSMALFASMHYKLGKVAGILDEGRKASSSIPATFTRRETNNAANVSIDDEIR